MRGGDDSKYNLVLNVVAVNLNVLDMLMKSGISSDDDGSLIITIHGTG